MRRMIPFVHTLSERLYFPGFEHESHTERKVSLGSGSGAVPHLVGPKCSQYEGEQKED